MELILVWNKSTFKQFERAIAFIEVESILSAEKFQTEILNNLKELLLQPERYPLINIKSSMMEVTVDLKN